MILRRVEPINFITARDPYRGLDGLSIKKLKKAISKVSHNISSIMPKPLQKLNANIEHAIQKVDTSVNKDFQKAKKWSQEHRKTLQIVAAAATIAIGGVYAYGALTAGGGSAAAGGTIASSVASEYGGAAALTEAGAAAGTAGAAASGGSIWGSIGSGLLAAGKTAATIIGVQTALAKKEAAQTEGEIAKEQLQVYQQEAQRAAGGGMSFGPAAGGGGGSFDSGPSGPAGTAQASSFPVVPVLLGGLALFLFMEK